MHRVLVTFAGWAALAAGAIGWAYPKAEVGDNLATGWSFAVGDPAEGLRASADRMPASRALVALPHRLLEPNTPLWYSRVLDLPADAAIDAQADDGAQVFVEGTRLEHERRTFFVPRRLSGRRTVIVRVLNNAMEGGLLSIDVRPGVARAPSEIESLGRTAGQRFAPAESAAFRARMPPADRPCDFTLWADSQGGWDAFAQIVSLMSTVPSHFSAGVGDLVNDGSDPDAWPRLVDTLAPLAAKVPIVAIPGNHDYDGYYNDLAPVLYLRWFRSADGGPADLKESALRTIAETPSWFAWSCGPARFVAIDMNREFPIGISPGSPQHAWLMREVASSEWVDARWRVLLVHQPPWSRSWRGYNGDEAVRRIVEPLTRERGLDTVVSGHSHAYERLTRRVGDRDLHGLIVGGAGGALEDAAAGRLDGDGGDRVVVTHHFVRAHATANALELTAIGLDGRVFDAATLAR